MATKMITKPFDVDLAKNIQKGKYPGKILTKDGHEVNIIYWTRKSDYPIVALIENAGVEEVITYNTEGHEYFFDSSDKMLELQIPEWINYKEGDIIICEKTYLEGGCFKFICLLKSKISFQHNHLWIDCCDYISSRDIIFNHSCSISNGYSIRLATEKEKVFIMEKLKASGIKQDEIIQVGSRKFQLIEIECN